jgi:hypothetical protein
VLVTGDQDRDKIPAEFQRLICHQLAWDKNGASSESARNLAEALQRQNIALAHFHFGGTYEWASNRFWRCRFLSGGAGRFVSEHQSPGDGVVELRRASKRPLGYRSGAGFRHSLACPALSTIAGEVCVSARPSAADPDVPAFRRKIISSITRYAGGRAADGMAHREPVVFVLAIGGRKAQLNLVEAFAGIAGRLEWQLEIIGRVGCGGYGRIEDCIARHGLAARVHCRAG